MSITSGPVIKTIATGAIDDARGYANLPAHLWPSRLQLNDRATDRQIIEHVQSWG